MLFIYQMFLLLLLDVYIIIIRCLLDVYLMKLLYINVQFYNKGFQNILKYVILKEFNVGEIIFKLYL